MIAIVWNGTGGGDHGHGRVLLLRLHIDPGTHLEGTGVEFGVYRPRSILDRIPDPSSIYLRSHLPPGTLRGHDSRDLHCAEESAKAAGKRTRIIKESFFPKSEIITCNSLISRLGYGVQIGLVR